MNRFLTFLTIALLFFVTASSAFANEENAGGIPSSILNLQQYETGIIQSARFFEGFKWNGDIRIRYDAFFDDTGTGAAGTSDRERGRFAMRLGFTKIINPSVTVGLRFATGTSANPTGTFQSFDNAAVGKTIGIDLAYLDVVPFSFWRDIHIVGGKMPQPFRTTSLVWDRDVTPEGIAETLKLKRDKFEWSITGGQFFMEDNSAPDDPYMLGGQIGFVHTLSTERGMKWSLTAGQYHFVRPYSIDATAQSKTNFLAKQHLQPNGYSIFDLSGWYELTVGDALPLRVSGGYIQNLSATPNTFNNQKENRGWTADLQLGRIDKAGTWEIGGGWRSIESDAALGQFTESEFNSSLGNTDIQGWTARISYSPWSNTTLGVSGFHSSRISARNISERNRIESTIGVKF